MLWGFRGDNSESKSHVKRLVLNTLCHTEQIEPGGRVWCKTDPSTEHSTIILTTGYFIFISGTESGLPSVKCDPICTE